MKLSAVLLVLCLLAAATPCVVRARPAANGCASSAAKLTDPPKLSLPEDAKVTAKSIRFEVDVGSDGRVRSLQMVQGSGDANVDLGLRQALQAAAYEPAQTGCVAYSAGVALPYSLTSDATVEPTTTRVSTCTPYISAFIAPLPRDRKRTGTAIVAVELDASATRTGTPALRKSTGSPVLDREALRIAAAGHYSFLRDSPCSPQAFVYPLELTFQ